MTLKQILRYVRRAVVPFAMGWLVGWMVLGHRKDPNEGWKPQARESFFCDRDELSRVSGGIHGWSAVAFNIDCDVLGNWQTKFVYLLKPGQSISPATLLVSYEGDAPRLRWESPTALSIQADNVDDVLRQAAKVGDVTIHLHTSPAH